MTNEDKLWESIVELDDALASALRMISEDLVQGDIRQLRILLEGARMFARQASNLVIDESGG